MSELAPLGSLRYLLYEAASSVFELRAAQVVTEGP